MTVMTCHGGLQLASTADELDNANTVYPGRCFSMHLCLHSCCKLVNNVMDCMTVMQFSVVLR